MLQVANPIYDSAFKYLMEDLEVARSFIGALIRKNVIKVEMRRNEYSNIQKEGISIFRIDFGATVLEEDGSEHVVLIELQKSWVETEVLRFRQYLGAQYGNPANIYSSDDKKDPRNGYGIPIVSVYILGHKVGGLQEPVVYISRNYLNYDNELLHDGVPDPFVESLTHDSIIVQIPLLKGMMRNRLERLLNVFDQSRRKIDNHQVLEFADGSYSTDPEVQRILTRLYSAVSDVDLRMRMNVEDEIEMTLNIRKNEILEQKQLIKEQNEQISQQSEQISQQSEQISQQSEQISQQNEQISQQNEQISQQNEQISQQKAQLKATIKMLLAANVPIEVIAQNLNLSTEEISYLKE